VKTVLELNIERKLFQIIIGTNDVKNTRTPNNTWLIGYGISRWVSNKSSVMR